MTKCITVCGLVAAKICIPNTIDYRIGLFENQ